MLQYYNRMIYHNTLTYCNEETKSIWFGVATGLSCLTIGTIEMMIMGDRGSNCHNHIKMTA